MDVGMNDPKVVANGDKVVGPEPSSTVDDFTNSAICLSMDFVGSDLSGINVFFNVPLSKKVVNRTLI